jgi:hypothetical protein
LGALKAHGEGTQIHVSAAHLQRYVEEQTFRFNERKNTDGPRFATAVKMVEGKKLKYKRLTVRSANAL